MVLAAGMLLGTAGAAGVTALTVTGGAPVAAASSSSPHDLMHYG